MNSKSNTSPDKTEQAALDQLKLVETSLQSNFTRKKLHFHMLFLDGVYTETTHGRTRIQRPNWPEQQELKELVQTISHRVARFLEREDILERDEENSYLNLGDADEDPMQQVLGCSVSY